MQPQPLEYAQLFAADGEWLSCQQGMDNFEQGCGELVEQMNGWINECVADICGESIDLTAEQHAGYLQRVWGCWRCRWKMAMDESLPHGVADRHAAADVMRGLRPVEGEDKPGTDLIRDVVLVEAVLMGNEAAIAEFDRVHSELVKRLVVGFDRSLQSDRSWWEDTKSRLFGTPKKEGQLKGFNGTGSLHSFMSKAIKRDLCRANGKIKREHARLQAYREDVVETDHNTPANVAVTRDCHALFRKAWHEALDDSPSRDRAAAKLVLAQGMPGNKAAEVLEKDPGTISKTLQRVYGRFRDIIYQPNGDFSAVFRDCGEHLFGGRELALGLLQEVILIDYDKEAQP